MAVRVTSEDARGDPGKDVIPVGVAGTPVLDLRECMPNPEVAVAEGPPEEGTPPVAPPESMSLYDAEPPPPPAAAAVAADGAVAAESVAVTACSRCNCISA